MIVKQYQQDEQLKAAETLEQPVPCLIMIVVCLIWVITFGWIIDLFSYVCNRECTYFDCLKKCFSGNVKTKDGEANNYGRNANNLYELSQFPVQKNSQQPKMIGNQNNKGQGIVTQFVDNQIPKSHQNKIKNQQQYSSVQKPPTLPPTHQNKPALPPSTINQKKQISPLNQSKPIHPLSNINQNKPTSPANQNKPTSPANQSKPTSPANQNKAIYPTPTITQSKPNQPPSSIDQKKVHLQIFEEEDNKPKLKVQAPVPLTLRGLKNIGNTCYMNAALQCLHKTTYFTQQLIKQRQSFEQSRSQRNKKLVELFSQLDSQLNKPLRKDQQLDYYQHFAPRAIKQKVAESNFLFAQNQQCDSIEFISTFLSIISDELNRRAGMQKNFKRVDRKKTEQQIYALDMENDEQRGLSIIDDVFASRYRTSYVCQELIQQKQACNFEFVIFEKFNIHYLEIPSTPQPTIVDCLRLFQKKDVLQGQNMITCEKCQRETVSHKSMKVYSPNKILTIVLKRFADGYTHKNTKKVKIPQFLNSKDISPGCKTDKTYRLYAACLHFGSLHSGHYTAVCLDRSSGKWIRYDDSFCDEIGSFEQVNFDNAYGLFYEQCPSGRSGQKKEVSSTQR